MLALPPELTQRQATACLRLLLQGLKAQPERAVRVDAKALTRFDSTALAVLLECRRAALSEGRGFAVQDLPLALAGMARLYGVDGLLNGGNMAGHGGTWRESGRANPYSAIGWQSRACGGAGEGLAPRVFDAQQVSAPHAADPQPGVRDAGRPWSPCAAIARWPMCARGPVCTPASVASPIRCRRLRAAIGAQRKAHRAAHTDLYWQAMQRRDALRWPAQTDR